jgi:hypothetical protein
MWRRKLEVGSSVEIEGWEWWEDVVEELGIG